MYRQIAIGDFFIFTVLAIPGLGSLVVDWLADLNSSLGLGGDYQGSPAAHLFIHLLGLLGAAFAVLKLRLPETDDAVVISIAVKFLAAGLFLLFVIKGAPVLFAGIAVVDAGLGLVLTALYLSRVREGTRRQNNSVEKT